MTGAGAHNNVRRSRNGQVRESPAEHPELEKLYAIDVNSCTRQNANSDPIPFDSEHASGFFLPMIRTSDADVEKSKASAKSSVKRGTVKNDAVSDYFRPKQRRFEMQMQIKFKEEPESGLWFGCMLDDPIKLNKVQKMVVKTAMNFVNKKNSGAVHYNVTGNKPDEDEDEHSDEPCKGEEKKMDENETKAGNYEVPHISFGVETAFNIVVVSKPGDIIPQLGTDIVEDPELRKYRKKNAMKFNATDTYTLCIWSAYVDFLDWKVVNMPVIRNFSIANFFGDQTIYLSIYTLKNRKFIEGEDKESKYGGTHNVVDMCRLIDYELSHGEKTRVGKTRRKWMEKVKVTTSR